MDRIWLEDYRYDPTHGCSGRPQIGALALRAWLRANVRGRAGGIYACRRSRVSRKWSLHAEGRAIDWYLDAARPRERKAAYALIDALLAPDGIGRQHALARRMGVQQIIYDCRLWTAKHRDAAPRRYHGCTPGASRTTEHRDHIHLGLNWRGAKKRSSFWRLSGR